jgi:hypothetical protein
MESVSLARAFVAYCEESLSHQDLEDILERASFPNLLQVANIIKRALDEFIVRLPISEDSAMLPEEILSSRRSFISSGITEMAIVNQLMQLARKMDFGDEVGRRTLSVVIRE